MTEEDQESFRPTSPYHEKCFPPYCESAGPMDKQSLSKMDRKDLEDKYIVYADENLTLKKRMRDQERHIQRLQTAMTRQENLGKKGGMKMLPSAQFDNARLDCLETQNKNLQAKVKVLKQQLMNHSFIHSKEIRIAENKEKQYKNPDYNFRDVGQTQSARDSKPRYKSPSTSARDMSNTALKERIAVLENSLETQKEKFRSRISQLEKELGVLGKSSSKLNEELSEHSRKVSDNLEIIKLRREGKKLSAQIESLTDQNETFSKELDELKAALKKAKDTTEELEIKLEREREKGKDSRNNLAKSASHTETIKAMTEEIRDLKNERKELKDANEQLLLLTTTPSTKSEKSLGEECRLRQQIVSLDGELKEKNKQLEEKEADVARLTALLLGGEKTTTKSYQEGNQGEIGRLQKNLDEAMTELEVLRRIAADHKYCKTTSPSTEAVVQQRPKKRWPDPKLVILYGATENEVLKPSRVRLMDINSNTAATPAPGPSTSDKQPQIEETSGRQLFPRREVSDLSKRESDLLHTSTPDKRVSKEQDQKTSIEVQHIDYSEFADNAKIPEDNMNKTASKAHFSEMEENAVVTYQPRENTLNDFLLQELPRTPLRTPPASKHTVEEIPGEPSIKPDLIIVSKHEFEAILMKKKKYFSQTEIIVPAHSQQAYNCKMEICVYDLEVDNKMVDYLSDIESDPQVLVVWDFLGLEQRTLPMPVTRAHFHTNVVYCGPLSENMARHVQQIEMPIYLMLATSDGKAAKVGEGRLDLSPAIDQPNRGFLRCVNLSGDRGYATVYCSFKLHDCCPGSSAPAAESLEVGIGHLTLKNLDLQSNPNANHLYIEYSLLGHCGSELETDSVPKGEVMQFNHTKRLKVDESNVKHLEPLLKPNHPKMLRFLVLSEPCNLTQGTEIEEIGHADLNLMEEMVKPDQDAISTEIPVYNNAGELMGCLSVTVIGNATLQNYTDKQS